MPKLRRETYKKRSDNLIGFCQLNNGDKFFASVNNKTRRYSKQGCYGMPMCSEADREAGQEYPTHLFGHSEMVGLTAESVSLAPVFKQVRKEKRKHVRK